MVVKLKWLSKKENQKQKPLEEIAERKKASRSCKKLNKLKYVCGRYVICFIRDYIARSEERRVGKEC